MTDDRRSRIVILGGGFGGIYAALRLEKALAPLGYKVLMEVPVEHTGGVVVLGMGVPPKPDFWLHQGPPQRRLLALHHLSLSRTLFFSVKP